VSLERAALLRLSSAQKETSSKCFSCHMTLYIHANLLYLQVCH
jgi:hypothetical protein